MNDEDVRYWLSQGPAHTDHPSRHWDRTCPACVAEHSCRDDAIAHAVKQCIDFGWYGVNPPPSGHWLNEMWDYGRSLATEKVLDRMVANAEELGLYAAPVERPIEGTDSPPERQSAMTKENPASPKEPTAREPESK